MPLLALENRWPAVRDILSFVVGTYVVIVQMNETPKDPTTLAFGAALMGIPAMLAGKKNGAAK